jgi:hypothetical protein
MVNEADSRCRGKDCSDCDSLLPRGKDSSLEGAQPRRKIKREARDIVRDIFEVTNELAEALQNTKGCDPRRCLLTNG